MKVISRRRFASWLLAPMFGYRRGDGQEAAARPRLQIRHYRADATILLFGVPIYRRAGVGGGQASIEESGAATSLQRTFFFAAGSDPRHAHGVSRVGWIREVVEGPGAAPREVTYFGVMTASPEESLAHARKSVSEPPATRSLYSAVSGRNTAGHSRSAIAHFEFPSSAIWSDERLINEAQAKFRENVEWRQTNWPDAPDRAPSTFLSELATLLQQRVPRASGRYIYNEQAYTLTLESTRPRPGASPADRLVLARGAIRNQRTRRQTIFQIWIEDAGDSVVPVRIQFQPRSFLRLTFEAVPA